MRCFRIVVAVSATAATAATLTVRACFTGMYGLFVRSNRTVSRHCAIDCCCALSFYEWCETNKSTRKNTKSYSYNNTVNRTTQYYLYILQQYVQSIQFLNYDEQFLKKNRKQGSFEQLVRETAFSKIFENNIYAPKMHHTCTIHYGACMVHVWCMYGAFREFGA